MDKISEYPAGSREWWRDWSAYWMREAQASARLSKELQGCHLAIASEGWRILAVGQLRKALQDYKRSLTAPDASQWPGFRL